MIIALEEAKYTLSGFEEKLKELGSALRIDELRKEAAELEESTSVEGFWNDAENSAKILRNIKQVKSKIENF